MRNAHDDFPGVQDLLAEADALLDASEYMAALTVYSSVLDRAPHHQAALQNAALAHFRLQQFDSAASLLHRLASLTPDVGDVWLTLGEVYAFDGRLAEAACAFGRAVRSPGCQLEALCGLAETALGMSDLESYRRYVTAALRAPAGGPRSIARRALLRLRDHELLQGFADRGAMWSYSSAENSIYRRLYSHLPWWNGTALGKHSTLLIHSEDGFGDTLQFVRFVPEAAILAGCSVVLAVAPPLHKLLRENLAAHVTITSLEDAPRESATAQIPLLALPRVLGATAATLGKRPYLSAPTHGPDLPPPFPGANLKIGLVWTGNPENLNNRWRSCQISDFRPILELRGVTPYSLQCGSRACEADGQRIIRLDHLMSNFGESAFLMHHLDAVVTICSSCAHLAGALGIPTFVMVHTQASWRWGLDEATPWYGSVRVCRQPAAGDWRSVIERIATHLA